MYNNISASSNQLRAKRGKLRPTSSSVVIVPEEGEVEPNNMQSTSSSQRAAQAERSSTSADITEVHSAWLTAGSNGDVATMRALRRQFPDWLDLQRVRARRDDARGLIITGTLTTDVNFQSVGPATPDSSSRPRSCSWTNFHLRTIGASTLHTAAWNGDLAIVQFLLEEGQSPDTGDEAAVTPMMVAILRLTIMTMRCVIRNGEAVRRNILVDCRQEEDAQQKQVVAVISLLLQFGADVDARGQDGKTALHYSTSDDAYEVAKFLLDAGASMDVQDENGKTPLHYCVQEGGLLVTELLLSRGATIDLEDKDGKSPLTLVVQRANLNVLQLILNHYQWNVTPERLGFGGAVLLRAVECQVEEVVRFMVDNDYAAVTARNAKGETPMHLAIMRRDPSMMELLADMDPEGNNLTATTTTFETPAHYAARYGSHREVHTLLQCLTSAFGDLVELPELGAENPLLVEDQSGMTCLHVASTLMIPDGSDSCLESRDAKVQLLLDHGAQIFSPGVLARKLASRVSDSRSGSLRLVFPVEVKSCLGEWLVSHAHSTPVQDGNDAGLRMQALTELCMRLIGKLAYSGTSLTLLSIVTGAGYGVEVMPLLLDLPLQTRDIPALLHDMEDFARDSALLLQLLGELRMAWSELELL